MARIAETSISLIPKYYIDQAVYALSINCDSINNAKVSMTKDEWDRDYVRIYKVKIVSIYTDIKGITYVVKGVDGKEWGTELLQEHISITTDELFSYLFNRWKL